MRQKEDDAKDRESSFTYLYLQRLAANEVGPSVDLRGNAFFAGEPLAHAAGEELGCL
jgi:hypothetical protein